MTEIPDHLTEAGAVNLARKLEAYWKERGFDVDAIVQRGIGRCSHMDKSGGAWFVVRSNLVNGLPPGATVSNIKRIQRVAARARRTA